MITSLEGCPKKLYGRFDCSRNKLKNLIGGPEILEGEYNCADNKITSAEGAPEKVYMFTASNNKLSSFEHFPSVIDHSLNLISNEFTSIKGISDHIKEVNTIIDLRHNDIKEGGLGLLKIKGLQRVEGDKTFENALKIISRYLKDKKGDVCVS